MGKIRKLSELPIPDRLALVKSFVLLVLVRLALLTLPYKAVQRVLEWTKSRSTQVQDIKTIDLARIVWAVEVSSRYLPHTRCLAKAVVTQILFAHYGYVSNLCIGVKKEGRGGIKAHAWVEIQGQIVVGDLENLSQFHPLVPYNKPHRCIKRMI